MPVDSLRMTDEERAFLIWKMGGEEGCLRFIYGEDVDPRNDIFRRAHVDSKQSLRQALNATGRNVIANDEVLETAPLLDGGDVGVYFFKIERLLNGDQIVGEYRNRYVVPVGHRSLAAVNQEDVTLADTRPNALPWKVGDKWYFLVFDQKDGIRRARAVPQHAVSGEGPLWFPYYPGTREILSPLLRFVPDSPFSGR